MFISVYCRSDENIPVKDLIELIESRGFFDSAVQYNYNPQSPEAAAPDWEYFEIIYEPGKRPIQIERINDDSVSEAIEELIDEIEYVHGESAYAELAEALRDTRQEFAIEIGADSMSDAAWNLIDALEMNWCRKLDGYIYVAGEGVYDSSQRRICNFEAREWRDLSLIDPRFEINKKEIRSIDVFCLSDEIYPADNISEYFDLSGAFEDDTEYAPPLGELGEEWAQVEADYQNDMEKVSFYRYVRGDGKFEALLSETLELQKSRLESEPDLAEHMRRSLQAYSIVYHEPTLDEDADLVINNIAFNMAEDLDGIVSTYDGFYDYERNWLSG